MRLGVFGARADRRGLATLSALMVRPLQPVKIVVVDMGKHSPTAFDPLQYPAAEVVSYDSMLVGTYDFAPFLDGLDAVLTFEIPYDFRLFTEARKRGVHSTCLVMPELDPWVRQPREPRPDMIALPTSWMAYRYPDSPVLPIPSDPWVHSHTNRGPAPPETGQLVVHPSALAMRDRNGTRVLIEASRTLPWQIVIRGQSRPDQPWWNARVETADLPHSRDLYNGAAVVVIPRRYGGLSLSMQEAMSAGLPLLVGEHDEYAHHLPPEARIRSIRGRNLEAKGGSIVTYDCDPVDAVEKIGAVMADPGLRDELAACSKAWTEANSWAKIRHAWAAVLGATVSA
jgi:hypothetical protein